MAGSVTLTGKDVIVINGRVLHNFADGVIGELTYAGNLMEVKASKDGNTIYGMNEQGRVCDLKLRLQLGSGDDKVLNSLLTGMKADPAGFILMVASFTKRVGAGDGKTNLVVYQCTGGAFSKMPGVKSDASGSTDQSVVEWNIVFGNADRAIM